MTNDSPEHDPGHRQHLARSRFGTAAPAGPAALVDDAPAAGPGPA